MIKSALEMKEISTKNKRYEEGYEQAIKSVMRAIKDASERGYRKTCFNPRAYYYKDGLGVRHRMDFYNEVKEEFEMNGYRFKPTGYVDGVWQQSEDICW